MEYENKLIHGQALEIIVAAEKSIALMQLMYYYLILFPDQQKKHTNTTELRPTK